MRKRKKSGDTSPRSKALRAHLRHHWTLRSPPRLRVQVAHGWLLAYRKEMHVSIEQLAEEAMGLPAESRAKLADILVESLDVAELSDIDALWLDEAKRRRDDARAGRVATIPGDEALRKVRRAVRIWTVRSLTRFMKSAKKWRKMSVTI